MILLELWRFSSYPSSTRSHDWWLMSIMMIENNDINAQSWLKIIFNHQSLLWCPTLCSLLIYIENKLFGTGVAQRFCTRSPLTFVNYITCFIPSNHWYKLIVVCSYFFLDTIDYTRSWNKNVNLIKKCCIILV